jgi:dTDP-4-amino-4,6-dideoxygalactose transaminase
MGNKRTEMKLIPLMIPDLRKEDIDLCIETLKSGNIVQGKQAILFEESTRQKLNVPHSFLTSNGTSTMHLALLASGIGPGDEVIVPAFSYVATANVVELVGAKTVFVDVLLEDCNIDSQKIEESITSKTKAIIPVHEFGCPANMLEIQKIAEKNNLIIIEDAACAFGATYQNKPVGSIGDFGSFSFHPRKAMTSGEGGLLTIKNSSHARIVKGMRSHGWNDSGECEWAGYNYRITDFQAALLNSQLNRSEEEIEIRKELVKNYNDQIVSSNILKPQEQKGNKNSWQSYHIIFKDSIRDQIRAQLLEAGIQSSYGAQCIPMMKYYIEKYNLNSDNDFPNAKKAFENGLVLPLYSRLKKEEQQYIIKMINKLVP